MENVVLVNLLVTLIILKKKKKKKDLYQFIYQDV